MSGGQRSRKQIVITGSEGLIGRFLVKHFQEEYSVHRLDVALGHDLCNEDIVSDWFKQHGGLHGMIVAHAFNPVPTPRAPRVEPTQVSLEEIRSYLEVNTVSAFNVTRQFILNNLGGSIINISSLYGVVSPRHEIYNDYVKPIGYSLSKGAVIAMSKYLATYYAPKFRLNTVVLGGVADPRQDPAFVVNYSQNTPMRRMMNLEEVPGVFEFLLDERSSYVTGSEFVVDGGWTTW